MKKPLLVFAAIWILTALGNGLAQFSFKAFLNAKGTDVAMEELVLQRASR